jgi:hypothetical protein
MAVSKNGSTGLGGDAEGFEIANQGVTRRWPGEGPKANGGRSQLQTMDSYDQPQYGEDDDQMMCPACQGMGVLVTGPGMEDDSPDSMCPECEGVGMVSQFKAVEDEDKGFGQHEAVDWGEDPNEPPDFRFDANAWYEWMADRFYKRYGRLPPGKDRPAAMGEDPDEEETIRLWRDFAGGGWKDKVDEEMGWGQSKDPEGWDRQVASGITSGGSDVTDEGEKVSPEDVKSSEESWEEQIPGGLAAGKEPGDFSAERLAQGVEVELEHTDDMHIAIEIAMDHLEEDPDYYDKLRDVEKKDEAKEPHPLDCPKCGYPRDVMDRGYCNNCGHIEHSRGYDFTQDAPKIAQAVGQANSRRATPPPLPKRPPVLQRSRPGWFKECDMPNLREMFEASSTGGQRIVWSPGEYGADVKKVLQYLDKSTWQGNSLWLKLQQAGPGAMVEIDDDEAGVLARALVQFLHVYRYSTDNTNLAEDVMEQLGDIFGSDVEMEESKEIDAMKKSVADMKKSVAKLAGQPSVAKAFVKKGTKP